MNIQQLARNQQLKKKLQSRKEERIKKKLAARQRQKTNLDFSHLKSGKMEKSKIIQKKVFRTEVQKTRKIEVTVQDNANSSTFINQSSQYLAIMNRTKNYIKFDKNRLLDGCRAISAYAVAHRQDQINIELTMESPVQCNECPVMLRLPHSQQGVKCVILTKNNQQLEQNVVKDADIRILQLKEFVAKYKADKQFKKQIGRKSMRVFCDFTIFAKSKLIKRLMSQKIIVFPIDPKKVPFSLQGETTNYKDYIRLLLSSSFFITKPGQQHRIGIQNRESGQLADNIESVVHQAVARLIQKNKAKGNKLISAHLRTQTSIPIDIYG